jgi:hypothetical protein
MKRKNVFVLTAFAVATMFTSCSSDDSSGPSTKGDLVGKWEFSKQSFTGLGQTSPEQDYEGNVPGCAKDYLQFNADGTGVEGDYVQGCDLISTAIGWSRNGKTISIGNADGDIVSGEIIELTASKLRVKSQESISGVPVTVNVTFTRAN